MKLKKELNIIFNNAEIDNFVEQIKSLSAAINEIGLSSEEAASTLRELTQYIATATTEKKEPLEIFDPIEQKEDDLFIVPEYEEVDGYIELWKTEV